MLLGGGEGEGEGRVSLSLSLSQFLLHETQEGVFHPPECDTIP